MNTNFSPAVRIIFKKHCFYRMIQVCLSRILLDTHGGNHVRKQINRKTTIECSVFMSCFLSERIGLAGFFKY